ncbi:MAG TPA: histidine phosphatase family protein [Dehalococcoidales bacterium]|nr:histidine phosphatase family protein [Dehalococcoidales bacterium]
MAKILLVRHGETEKNSSQRYWGKTDVNLGPVGLRQAEQLRDRLAATRIDYVYSSEMRRAVLTARTIASIHGLSEACYPELREIDFGQIEGLNFTEVQQQFPKVARMWIERDPALSYPNGESLAQLDFRLSIFRNRLIQHGENEVVMVVAHSGVLRTLICQLLGLETRNRWDFRIDLASLSIVETFSGAAVLSLLNDTSHLLDGCK